MEHLTCLAAQSQYLWPLLALGRPWSRNRIFPQGFSPAIEIHSFSLPPSVQVFSMPMCKPPTLLIGKVVRAYPDGSKRLSVTPPMLSFSENIFHSSHGASAVVEIIPHPTDFHFISQHEQIIKITHNVYSAPRKSTGAACYFSPYQLHAHR